MAIKLRKEVKSILFSMLKCLVADVYLPVAWLPPRQAFLGKAGLTGGLPNQYCKSYR